MSLRILAHSIAAALIAALAFGAPARAANMLLVPATASSPPIPIYVVRPPGNGPFPAVLLLHGCGGFDGYLAVGADRLAARGYVGVALDSLAPHGMTTACNGNSDGDEAGAARAALAWLRKQPFVVPDRLGVIGFSMGADAALTLIDTPGSPAPAGLRAAAIYYPSCEDRDGLVSVPLDIFDGDADKIAPSAPCAAMAHAGAAAGKPITITTYPGATHGFDVPGPDRTFFGAPIHYDAAASADAARQIFAFLQRYVGPGVQ
jgi:dienelactone hydrolase